VIKQDEAKKCPIRFAIITTTPNICANSRKKSEAAEQLEYTTNGFGRTDGAKKLI